MHRHQRLRLRIVSRHSRASPAISAAKAAAARSALVAFASAAAALASAGSVRGGGGARRSTARRAPTSRPLAASRLRRVAGRQPSIYHPLVFADKRSSSLVS